jgi:hypothetical protein
VEEVEVGNLPVFGVAFLVVDSLVGDRQMGAFLAILVPEVAEGAVPAQVLEKQARKRIVGMMEGLPRLVLPGTLVLVVERRAEVPPEAGQPAPGVFHRFGNINFLLGLVFGSFGR